MKSQQLNELYVLKWKEVFIQIGFQWEQIPIGLLKNPYFEYKFSKSMIQTLSEKSDIRSISIALEESKETTSELIHQIHLSKYSPDPLEKSPLPQTAQLPSSEIFWETSYGKYMKGNGLNIATGERGISQSMVTNLGLNSSQVYSASSTGHSELVFLSMYRAAPEANHFHFRSYSKFKNLLKYGSSSVNLLEENDIQILSISYVNVPPSTSTIDLRTYDDYIEQVRSQYSDPFPLIVGPADNVGDHSSQNFPQHFSRVSWASWATLVVGASQYGGKMSPIGANGRCSSSENWPSMFNSPFGGVELPHIVAPGFSNGLIVAGVQYDGAIRDTETQHQVICGTSFSAPLVVGTIASLMSYMEAFKGFPEIGKVVAMLSAVNAHGEDAYTTYDPNIIITHDGKDYIGLKDGVDGTGELNAFQAGEFLHQLGYTTSAESDNKRMWPVDHDLYFDSNANNGMPQKSGLSWFYFRAGLVDAAGNLTRYGHANNALVNADATDIRYAIQVPSAAEIGNKKLRVVFTWQARLDANDEITVDDYDIQIDDIHGNPLTPDNVGNSWENNVEVIDWEPDASMYGKTVYLTIQGSYKGPINIPTGIDDIRAVVGWGWVQKQSR